MKKYMSLLLLGSLIFAAPMPANAESKPESTGVQILAQSNTQAAIAQELISLLSDGKYEEAVAKYDFDQSVTAESLQKEWEDTIEKYGEFQQALETRESPSNLVVISCEFAEKTINLIIVLNDSNQVVSLNTPED
jgi:Flp pilus assembly CpaE family ATPase